MTFPIIVEAQNGSFFAAVLGAPHVRATGPTGDAAVEALKATIELRLSSGELRFIDVEPKQSRAGVLLTATIGGATSPLPLPFADPLSFTITFSEPVTGLDTTKIILGGSAVGGTAQSVTADADNKVFTVTVGGFTEKGDVTVTLAAGAASDAAGNSSQTTGPVTLVTADVRMPTVTTGDDELWDELVAEIYRYRDEQKAREFPE